jgi:hypothetical protein
VVRESAPEAPTQTEIAVSAKSAEKNAFTAHDGVVIEGSRIDRDGPASAPSGVTVVKVEFFAKPVPATVDELEAFSALCEQVMISNARNPASAPNATST